MVKTKVLFVGGYMHGSFRELDELPEIYSVVVPLEGAFPTTPDGELSATCTMEEYHLGRHGFGKKVLYLYYHEHCTNDLLINALIHHFLGDDDA